MITNFITAHCIGQIVAQKEEILSTGVKGTLWVLGSFVRKTKPHSMGSMMWIRIGHQAMSLILNSYEGFCRYIIVFKKRWVLISSSHNLFFSLEVLAISKKISLFHVTVPSQNVLFFLPCAMFLFMHNQVKCYTSVSYQ